MHWCPGSAHTNRRPASAGTLGERGRSGGGEVMLNVLRCQLTYQGQVVTNAEARFNNSLRPRKPEGSLGRTAQDAHLDSHTAPELWTQRAQRASFNTSDNKGHKAPTQ